MGDKQPSSGGAGDSIENSATTEQRTFIDSGIEAEIMMRRGPQVADNDSSSGDEPGQNKSTGLIDISLNERNQGAAGNSKAAAEKGAVPPVKPPPRSSSSDHFGMPVNPVSSPRSVIANISADGDESRPSQAPLLEALDYWNTLLSNLQMAYCRKIERHPTCFLIAYIIIFAIVLVAMWRPLEVDTDFESLMRADGNASLNRDTFLFALNSKKQNQDDGSRRLSSGEEDVSFVEVENDWLSDAIGAPRRQLTGRLYKRYELKIIYKATGGNMLSERTLRVMRNAEQKLRNMPKWKNICTTKVHSYNQFLCEPGESVSNYVWPSPIQQESQQESRQESQQDAQVSGLAQVLFKVNFDGLGEEQIPLPAALRMMEKSRRGSPVSGVKRFFPKGFDEEASGPKAQVLQSHFTFLLEVGTPLDAPKTVAANLQQAKKVYEAFVADELFPALVHLNKDPEPGQGEGDERAVRIYYNGHVISSYEIYYTLERDVLYAIGSMCFVTGYMWLHTRSVVRSLFCLIIIFASIPLAFVLTPASKSTIASFLSLFLIIGMGSDVMFIFTDFWSQADQLPMHARLSWTLSNAVKSCAATSVTTAASFFANLASVLRPLREFGFFMGMCVFGSFLLVSFLYPPFLVISEQRSCGKCRCPCRKKRKDNTRVVDISRQLTESGGPNLAIVPSSAADVDNWGSKPKSHTPTRGKVGSGASGSESTMNKVLSAIVSRSLQYRKCVVCLAAAAIVVFIVCIVTMAKLDTGLPEIFPKEHNQNEGQQMQGKFHTTSFEGNPPLAEGSACAPFSGWRKQNCMLHWCDAKDYVSEMDEKEEETDQCTCIGHWHYPNISPEANGTDQPWRFCQYVDVVTRISGSSNQPNLNDIRDMILKVGTTGTEPDSYYLYKIDGSGERLPMLALENWDSGQIDMQDFIEAPKMSFERISRYTQQAEYNLRCATYNLCHCKSLGCDLHATARIKQGSYKRPVRRLDSTNTVMPSTVAVHKQTGVDVLFGLLPPEHIPLLGEIEEKFKYDPAFDAENPWAQRALMTMCNVPPELQVTTVKCWPWDFKEWLAGKNERFPTRLFSKYIQQFAQSDVLQALHFWIKDGRLRAAKISFMTNIPIDVPVNSALRLMGQWDDFIETRNREASVTANGAWHTSRLWLRAEAETAIVDSTKDTILISVMSGFLGMLLFTQDLTLSMMVVILVMGIIAGLAFTMVAIMGWAIGPIEVLSLVIFVGYAVTYSLHVAHNYAEVEHGGAEHKSSYIGDADENSSGRSLSREQRVTEACHRIGGAMMGSALSTLGSAFFLFFCTMRVFVKLGVVVFAVTALSIIFALVVLPAMLATCGPSQPWSLRRLLGMGCSARSKKDADEDLLDNIVPGRPVS